MKRGFHMGKLVEKLRRHHDMSQEDLGREVGVSRASISAYETGADVPGEVCIKLLRFARDYEEIVALLDRAGVTPRSLLDAAERLGEASIVSPGPDDFVFIEQVEKIPGRPLRRTGLDVKVSAKLVPDRFSTHCFGVRSHPSQQVPDYLIVDTSESKSQNLTPFWRRLILAEFSSKDSRGKPTGWRDEVSLGVVYSRREASSLTGTVWFADFLRLRDGYRAEVATLPVEEEQIVFEPYDDRIKEGTAKEAHILKELTETEARRKKAEAEIRLAPGCTILGRVIALLPAPSEGKK